MLDKNEIQRRKEIVVEQFNGIIPHCEAFYVYSLHYSADRAMAAIERYEAAVAAGAHAPSVVSAVQEALTHAAALSRFFWPVRTEKLFVQRAKRLCEAFDVHDASPLECKDIRDTLEHFDERLDLYLLENDFGDFRPAPTVGSHTLTDEPTAKIFKLVDPQAHVLILLGRKYSFGQIFSEVERIRLRAISLAKRGRISHP